MDDKFIDELLEQYPDLVEILDYYLFVPKEIYDGRYERGDNEYLNYNLVYDLITNERGYSYVYALFFDLVIPGDNFCVGAVEGEQLYSIEINRAKLAASIEKYLSEGKLNFEGVYKERIDEILNKTSFESFYNAYQDEEFHMIIDGNDITIKTKTMIDFITLPREQFRDFFKDLDVPYEGIPKTYLVYMTVNFLLNNACFDDYLLSDDTYFRYEVLSSNELIDIEAINRIKKTVDDTVDKVKINEELEQAVLANLDDSLSDLEKAIYIYIKLCKILSYDDEFYALNQRGYVALKHQNPEGIYKITPDKNRVVCYEFNSIFAKFLEKLKIKFITKSTLNGIYKGHTSLMFRCGKFLVNADSVESILKCDLVSAKLNDPLTGLKCVNKNEETREEFANAVSKVYKIIATEENKTERIEENESFEDILRQYEEYVETMIDLDTKLSIMIDKVLGARMNGVDSIAYLLQLRRIIFSLDERERNIKISIVRDNVTPSKDRIATVSAIFTINKNDILEDIFNNQYYFFHPNYPLVPISIFEIEELFNEEMLEYIGDKYLEIPGLNIGGDCKDDSKTTGTK